MASYTKGAQGCVGKSDSFWFDPEELILITDPGQAGYDPRATLPPDPALVASIIAYGVLVPVLVRPGSPIVVDGRRRTIAAREANRQIKEAGGQPVRIKCIVSDGSEARAEAAAAICNEMRLDDNEDAKAERASRLRAHGYGPEEIALIFGVQPPTVKRWLKLADAPPEIRAAVRERKVSARAAAKLASAPQEDRAAAVEAGATERQAAAVSGQRMALGKREVRAILGSVEECANVTRLAAEDAMMSREALAWSWYCAGLRRAAGLPEED
jgi:ParB family chromosome partitioning protein